MTGPTQSPTGDTAPAPTEIDLEAYRAKRINMLTGCTGRKTPLDPWYNLHSDDIDNLIAAVEALRERVVEDQVLKQGYYDEAVKGWQKARTAEAHAVELAGALKGLIDHLEERAHWMRFRVDKDDRKVPDGYAAFARSHAALASTPPEALEWSKARDEVIGAVRAFFPFVEGTKIGVNQLYKALSKLDALQEEDEI